MKSVKDTLPLISQGKVRDIYSIPSSPESLLFVASDRISAYDVVLASNIESKGVILTQLSVFWFDYLKDIIKNHYISSNFDDMPLEVKSCWDDVKDRCLLVRKLKVVPIEAIVRGYITGSGWKEYCSKGSVCGITLPNGLKECAKLEKPVFTPSTKAEIGAHDENITKARMIELIGKELADKIENVSLKLYSKASEYALSKGIIIADTKFEFGLDESGELYLIDEVLTPDSSRFWPLDDYDVGRSQKSFDKQYVRDYLTSISFDKKNPVTLPDDVILKTREKYHKVYEILTGSKISQ